MRKFVRPFRFSKAGQILAGGAALALMLAACSPATSAGTATTEPLASAFPTSASTEALATGTPSWAATEIATSAATSAATEVATSAATNAATENATSAATAAVTANATAAGTEAANAPLLIESDKLLGMAVNDSRRTSLGTIVAV